ncbi:hypothetical protein PMAYCL1PPCAC_05581, partial [Pristionchus mayeri]
PNIPIISKRLQEMKAGSSILYSIIVMVLGFTAIGVLINTNIYRTPVGTGLMILFTLISIGSVLCIDAHQQNCMELDYKVFWVPYVPAVSLLFNVLMMTQLTILTWIRVAVWMTIGLAIYFFYGISHSKEELQWKEERRKIALKQLSVNIY